MYAQKLAALILYKKLQLNETVTSTEITTSYLNYFDNKMRNCPLLAQWWYIRKKKSLGLKEKRKTTENPRNTLRELVLFPATSWILNK